jgi:hypothetical protein
MIETELAFELLVIALNAPTKSGETDQFLEADARWKGREIELRSFFRLGPVADEPLLRCRGPGFGVLFGRSDSVREELGQHPST